MKNAKIVRQKNLTDNKRAEALGLIEHIKAVREKYVALKPDFEAFAMQEWPDFRETQKLKQSMIIGSIVCIVIGLLCVWLLPKESEKLAILFFILSFICMIVAALTNPNKDEMPAMVDKYLELRNLPTEEREIALRVFSDSNTYSDMPSISGYVARGILSKTDLTEMDIDIDPDMDFDCDGDD